MEEEIDPLFAFGRQVLPLQWFSVVNPDDMSEVIVGLQSTSSEPLRSGDAIFNISSIAPDDELISLIEAIEFNANLEASQQFSVDSQEIQLPGAIEYQFNVQSLADIAQGEVLAAFNVNYADLSVGGGSLTIELPTSLLDLPGADDPNTAPIVITSSMPRFNEAEIDDGIREFWGGTFVEAGTTEYVGQESFFDDIVLPGASTEYTMTVDENGVLVLTPVAQTNELFGEQYTVSNAERVIFGGDPSDRSDVIGLNEFSDAVSMSFEEFFALAQADIFATRGVPTIIELAEEAATSISASSSLTFDDFFLETLSDSEVLDQYHDVDFTDPSSSEEAVAFVRFFYTSYLGRAADEAGQAFWVNALTSGAVNLENFAGNFWQGIFADTGGVQDQRLFESLLEATQILTIEGGVTSEEIVASAELELFAQLNDLPGAIDFDFAREAVAEASDGDGVGDALTIQVVGLPNDGLNFDGF